MKTMNYNHSALSGLWFEISHSVGEHFTRLPADNAGTLSVVVCLWHFTLYCTLAGKSAVDFKNQPAGHYRFITDISEQAVSNFASGNDTGRLYFLHGNRVGKSKVSKFHFLSDLLKLIAFALYPMHSDNKVLLFNLPAIRQIFSETEIPRIEPSLFPILVGDGKG